MNVDEQRAAEIFEDLCERGKSDPHDPKAPQNIARACDRNDGEACYWLALQVRDGAGVTQDAERTKELMTNSCESGFEKACR